MEHTIDVQYSSPDAALPDERKISYWAKTALSGFDNSSELCIRIVDEEEGARLNETWRHKTGPTNVLSFPADTLHEIVPRLLGDVVICAPVVEREASEQGKKPEDHWAHMVIHGTLHLLGYDHINETDAAAMEEKETSLLSELDIKNPYKRL